MLKQTVILSKPALNGGFSNITCNKCGRAFDLWDIQEGFSIHRNVLGYGTKHDGSALHLNLCCDCMDKLISECRISPVSENK